MPRSDSASRRRGGCGYGVVERCGVKGEGVDGFATRVQIVVVPNSSKITKITIIYNGFGIEIIKNTKNNNYL